MARTHDELVGRLVRARLLALRRLAPRSDRVTTTRGTTFTTTMRVIDRVHCNAANVRTLATPYRTTGLAVVDVAVVRVGHCTDRSEAGTWNQTLRSEEHTSE